MQIFWKFDINTSIVIFFIAILTCDLTDIMFFLFWDVCNAVASSQGLFHLLFCMFPLLFLELLFFIFFIFFILLQELCHISTNILYFLSFKLFGVKIFNSYSLGQNLYSGVIRRAITFEITNIQYLDCKIRF